MKASSGAKSGFWNSSGVTETLDCLDIWCHLGEGQLLTTTDIPLSSACQSLRKVSQKREVSRISWCLKLVLMIVGRERSGSLMQIFWIGGDRVAG